jgi:hypothetical protein
MDPRQVRNPFVDENQTQHDSLRSGVQRKSKNSLSADQKGSNHRGSSYISFLLVLPVLFTFLFCSLLDSAPCKNGLTDFDDICIKRRGFTQGSRCMLWSQRLQKLPRLHFPQNRRKLGIQWEIPA